VLAGAKRHGSARHGGRVEPVQVIAVLGRGNMHPHLRRARRMWLCQVTGRADAGRQQSILRAIVECELHERIFRGSLAGDPGFAGEDATQPSEGIGWPGPASGLLT
jgi:hypothetical protein